MWEHLRILIRAIFPGIIVLQLADSNAPNMDKLFYYVRRLDRSLQQSKEILTDLPSNNQASSYCRMMMLAPTSTTETSDNVASSSEEQFDTDDEKNGYDNTHIGDHLISIWERCREKLVHAYAIAGWLVSPVPDIYEDAKANATGDQLHLVESLFKQLFSHCAGVASGNSLGNMISAFWSEHNEFATKTGKYDNHEHIWLCKTVKTGEIYLWHKMYSL